MVEVGVKVEVNEEMLKAECDELIKYLKEARKLMFPQALAVIIRFMLVNNVRLEAVVTGLNQAHAVKEAMERRRWEERLGYTGGLV